MHHQQCTKSEVRKTCSCLPACQSNPEPWTLTCPCNLYLNPDMLSQPRLLVLQHLALPSHRPATSTAETAGLAQPQAPHAPVSHVIRQWATPAVLWVWSRARMGPMSGRSQAAASVSMLCVCVCVCVCVRVCVRVCVCACVRV